MDRAMADTRGRPDIYERSMGLPEVGVIILDLDLKRVFVDDIAARIMGRSKEELLGGELGGGLVPEAREEARRLIRRCIDTGQATSRHVMKRVVNGRTIYTVGHAVPLRDENGKVMGVLTTTSDVTDAIKEDHATRRSLIDAVGGIVVRLDRSGKRNFVSEGAEDFQGRSKDEMLAGILGDNMLPEDREAAYEQLEKMFQTGEPEYGIVTRQRIGDELKHILANWVPVFGEDGKVVEVQTTSMDVTDQVRMREQLQSYGARIRHAQEEERLNISRFLHDDTIQTLAAVSHRVDVLMAKHDLPKRMVAEFEGLASALLDQSDALRRLCMGLRPAMLDRMGLGASIEWLVRNACSGNEVAGTVRVGESLRRLNPNVEIRLFRIAQEAVNNAVRHGKAKRIEVSLSARDGHVELEVKDDGIGFDKGKSPMQSLDNERLGLLGMRERAHILGAELDVQSEPGDGCRVFLRGSIERMEASV